MNIRMNTLAITEYCSTDKRKINFIKEVSEDPLIRRFVSHNMDEWLEDSEGVDKLLVGPAYIIAEAEERKLVGFIRPAFLENDGTLNLHYAVHPDYRKKHYGTRILEEISKYLFKEIPDVKKIELYIKEINQGSIHCATNAKFTLEREFQSRKDDCMIKVYSKHK